MDITLKLIAERFNYWNEKIFESNEKLKNTKLQTPTFEIGTFTSAVAMYKRKNGIKYIRFSNQYELSEADFDNVLVHEMLHQHVDEVLHCNETAHGYVWSNLATYISYTYKLMITVRSHYQRKKTNQVKSTELIYLCLILNNDDTYFLMRINKKYISQYYNLLSSSKQKHVIKEFDICCSEDVELQNYRENRTRFFGITSLSDPKEKYKMSSIII